jgi:hypothetical protein
MMPMPALPPVAAFSENASRTMVASTLGMAPACEMMTTRPPATYRNTFAGESHCITRPIEVMPPMITSHASTASTTPVTHVGTWNWLAKTTAMELGCVPGVVVSAATPATSA